MYRVINKNKVFELVSVGVPQCSFRDFAFDGKEPVYFDGSLCYSLKFKYTAEEFTKNIRYFEIGYYNKVFEECWSKQKVKPESRKTFDFVKKFDFSLAGECLFLNDDEDVFVFSKKDSVSSYSFPDFQPALFLGGSIYSKKGLLAFSSELKISVSQDIQDEITKLEEILNSVQEPKRDMPHRGLSAEVLRRCENFAATGENFIPLSKIVSSLTHDVPHMLIKDIDSALNFLQHKNLINRVMKVGRTKVIQVYPVDLTNCNSILLKFAGRKQGVFTLDEAVTELSWTPYQARIIVDILVKDGVLKQGRKNMVDTFYLPKAAENGGE